jgi:hypothetical protein
VGNTPRDIIAAALRPWWGDFAYTDADRALAALTDAGIVLCRCTSTGSNPAFTFGPYVECIPVEPTP